MSRHRIDRRHFLALGVAGGAAALVSACAGDDARTTSGQASSTDAGGGSGVHTIATGLYVPWGIAFLRHGTALVSQRDEASIVAIAPDGSKRIVGDVAGVAPRGEGGLQGIAMAPGDESVVFAYYTTDTDNRVATMTFDGERLGAPRPILTGLDAAYNHHGGALLFDRDGSLFVSVGDAAQADVAQDTAALNGSILRIDRTGRPWPGNPFGNEIWSYGHRNVEGMAFDAAGGLWATEFGANSTDELNLIRRGGNYGWPRFEGDSDAPDVIAPEVTWTTEEASPAGLAIVGERAYMGALRGERLWQIPLARTSTGSPAARYVGEYGRIRAVAAAPDGSLWFGTSNTDGRGRASADDDQILRITV
ncbi:PQQ-dependent sugar dehydrogenase [Gordonia soli]|uniref:Putative dehydrogenase n=1 Tax=Gordonia soli NBRC 108243 TaxID=1223545 RepID=M0QD59_9ACTN|nr:PQQ-dependent sugar dehydrogenase [Gordonia soli]GAC66261.1 putative dehydrogenase [Gordonia soli NBRC 108243]